MQIQDFVLENAEKVKRAIYGTPGKGGLPQGGVGDKASEADILAEYDRLGGLITKNHRKVKNGSFYDFDKRQPKEKPVIVYELRDLDGNKVELKEGEDIPLEVLAAEKRSKKKAEEEEDEEETPKPKKKSKKAAEDEE